MQGQLKRILSESDSRGFTIVEVIVVIAILAVIIAISMPNLKTWQSHSRVNRDTRTLLGALQHARMEAVKRNEYCAVAFGQVVAGTTYDYVVFFDRTTPTPNKVYDAADDEVILKDQFNYAAWTNNFPGGNAAIFNSRGLPSTSPVSTDFVIGNVELVGGDGYLRKVVVSKSGRIRVE